MRGFQWLLVCAILCVQLKYYSSQQVVEFFGTCTNDEECPDYAQCENTGGVGNQCRCEDGFDAIDGIITSVGSAVTECRDLGPCSPYDNKETDCGTNGRCVTYSDDNNVVRAACKCAVGYTGINCERPSTILPPIFTTRRPYVTTRRPGSNIGAIIPAIGGGVLLLALLAGGAAALASSTG